MAKPVIMPQVGQDIEKAVIVEWRVRENEPVKKGDILFVVESDKAVFEIESDETGVLLEILCGDGQESKVFETVAWIGESSEAKVVGEWITIGFAAGDTASAAAGQNMGTTSETTESAQPAEIPAQSGEKKVFSSPSARRAAREHNVDITRVKGSGPQGRILKKDVLATTDAHLSAAGDAEPAACQPHGDIQDSRNASPDVTVIPLSPVRQKIAERLGESKRHIPHFYLAIDVDMTVALKTRKEYNLASAQKISVNDIIIKSSAVVLRRFPHMNTHFTGDSIVLFSHINIGMAVAAEDSLLVPVIPDADTKEIAEIARLTRELIRSAGKDVPMRRKAPATFTISNLSMFRINYVLPIINPPECAILGVGGLQKRVVPIDDYSGIGVRDMITLTLTCDHRAVDGSYASRFLTALKKRLEKGEIG